MNFRFLYFIASAVIGILLYMSLLALYPVKGFGSKYTLKLEKQNDSIRFEILNLRAEMEMINKMERIKNEDFSNEDEKEKVMQEVYEFERKILTRSNTFNELKIVIDNIELSSPNYKKIPTIIPLKPGTFKRFSSGFGTRTHPIKKVTKFHSGLDISANEGTLVYASCDGTVISTGYEKGYGNYIKIKHSFGFQSIYGHLSQILIEPGKEVKFGQVIGEVGSTGMSTGPHLHYEIIKNGTKIDPIEFTWISQRKIEKNLSQDNNMDEIKKEAN